MVSGNLNRQIATHGLSIEVHGSMPYLVLISLFLGAVHKLLHLGREGGSRGGELPGRGVAPKTIYYIDLM